MNLNNLYSLTEKEKIKVYNWHIEDANGAYINIDKINAIALNYNNIGTYIEEKCVLAEELGHYYYDATILYTVKICKLYQSKNERLKSGHIMFLFLTRIYAEQLKMV